MKLNLEPIREWFGFTRRERRSSLILLILIATVIFLRYAMPLSVTELREVNARPPNIEVTDSSYTEADRLQSDTGKVKYNNRNGNSSQTLSRRRYEYVRDSAAGHYKNSAFTHYSHKKEKTELNICDSAELDLLPGIGPVLSSRIVKYRNLLGGFCSVDQLKEVYGLRIETFDKIKSMLVVDTMKISGIRVNTATYRELARFPYIGSVDASAIMKYRDLEGRINSIDELVSNKIISVGKVERLRHYLVFE